MTQVAEQAPLSSTSDAPPGDGSLADYFRAYLVRVRSGDLGSLPIIVGLLIIVAVFGSLRPAFLTAGNFTNLIVQMAGLTTIAIGVVFVLLLGEIDLSVGYVSGVAGVVLARLLTENGLPWFAAVAAAVLTGTLIGLLQGLIITKAGVPSFVVTLAGLLAWNGVVLILIGGRGTVVVSDRVVIGIANRYLPPVAGWVLAAALVAGFVATQLARQRARRAAGLPTVPPLIVALRVVLLSVLVGGAVVLCNASPRGGVPVAGVLMAVLLLVWSYVAGRTRFGRHVYAVGGNAEAARRAGIDVDRVRVAVFMIASTMAALGGVVLASRLRSVDTAAGGGDILLNSIAAAVIGGTSLFGGRGKVSSALLGALVIASVANGMGLLGLSSGAKFVVTGLVLLASLLVDSFARRGRSSRGLA